MLIKHNCTLLSRLTALRSRFTDKSTTQPRHSLIRPDVVISGSWQSAGDVYPLGRIEGKVECRRLFMSAEARVDEIASTTDIIHFENNT